MTTADDTHDTEQFTDKGSGTGADTGAGTPSREETPAQEPLDYPINGELDLHLFNPKEVKDLVPEYLSACREKGILHVRIVHGKGKGVLAKTVHAVLGRLEMVKEYHIEWEGRGSWGATSVEVKELQDKELQGNG